ncbi:succinate--CoA ligase subunit alpha, partial [Pseudomonas syringae pv. tagetis]
LPPVTAPPRPRMRHPGANITGGHATPHEKFAAPPDACVKTVRCLADMGTPLAYLTGWPNT